MSEKILDEGIVEEGTVGKNSVIVFFKNLIGTSLIQYHCGQIESKGMSRVNLQKWFQQYAGKKYRIIVEFYDDTITVERREGMSQVGKTINVGDINGKTTTTNSK